MLIRQRKTKKKGIMPPFFVKVTYIQYKKCEKHRNILRRILKSFIIPLSRKKNFLPGYFNYVIEIILFFGVPIVAHQ